ncbi:MAG: HD domain-containing protein, partial [Burkholderiales bacterium]|nr:HD domain-containing protein [Burkholderiales bacterium]
MASRHTPPVETPARRGRRHSSAANTQQPRARAPAASATRTAPIAETPVAAPALADAGFVAVADERQVVSLAGLTRKASVYLSDTDLERIREAWRFSDEAHLGQFRSSGEPYISHPIAVAEILAGWKLDADSLMAALLHDVIEDTTVAKQILIERFGPHVAELVDGLSKLERVEFASKEQQQAESFRKMLLAMARDV